MPRFFVSLMAAVSLVSVFSGSGCVWYSTYRDARDELSKATQAKDDLEKRYNQAMLQLAARPEGAGGDASALVAEIERLKREIADLRNKGPNRGFTAEEANNAGVPTEDGGLQLEEELLFSEGSEKFKLGATKVLDKVVTLLESHKGEFFVIEGHTDNQPLVHTKARWKYNMRLASERAFAVFEYLLEKGIPESAMLVRAYSFNKPTDPGTADTKAGRDKNRRVVIRRGGTTAE